MRFIHAADWHLGRLFHGVHLTEDQAYVLDAFVDLVADVRPAAVLIAGDVYDRSVPPTDAVDLLNDVLARIVLGLQVPVVMIAGNHDSATRLGFGARLLADQGLHIAGRPGPDVLSVGFAAADGPVVVQAIPYAEPVETRAALGEDGTDIHDHQAAMAELCGRARAAATAVGARRVLVAHAFVAGSSVSESERPLSVGGSGEVAASVFDGTDYVALGHLHRPQAAGGPRLAYAGSLLKYSFGEADHAKSVAVVELGRRQGDPPRIERVALAPKRDVRVVEGTLHDVLERGLTDAAHYDYVCAQLLDKGALLDPMGQLREVYPNVLTIDRSRVAGQAGEAVAVDPSSKSETEHFAAFFEYVCGEPLDEAERLAFAEVADRIERRRREA